MRDKYSDESDTFGASEKAVRKLGRGGVALELEGVVHVSEGLLLGNQRDVKALCVDPSNRAAAPA